MSNSNFFNMNPMVLNPLKDFQDQRICHDISQYLKDGFDPNSLKVAELKSVLKENGIPFASSSRKPQLVEIFQKQIIDNTKIKAELIKKQSLKDETSVSELPVSSSKNSNSKSKSKTRSKHKVKAPDQSLDLSIVGQPEIQIQPSSSPNVPQAQQAQKLATQLEPEDILLHSQAEANIHGDSLLQSSYANVQPLNTSQFPTNIHHNFQMNNVSPPPMNYQMNTNIPLQPHQLAQQQQQQQQQQQFPMNASFPLNYHPANFSYQGYPNSPYMNLPPNLYNQIPLPNNSEIFNNTTFNNDPFLNNLKSPIMNSQLSPTKLRDILNINNTAITNNDIDNTNNVIDKNKTSTNITQNEPTIKKETKSPTSKVSTITTKGRVTKLPHTPVLKSQKNTEDSKIDLKEIIKSSKKNAAATPLAASERKRRSRISETSNIKSSPLKKENQDAIPIKIYQPKKKKKCMLRNQMFLQLR
ncbi:unnamed protein product [[Candida] boidinii]|uniref:Unnamed protein product n=1 Tax=Candida boidinii TaxID=5477 RepID=A0A9W6T3K8_CANBO|nr:unnamed protein product [[Candida] boidinii]